MRFLVRAMIAMWPAVSLAADPSIYTGVAGATAIDSGVFVVASGPSAREETFEFVRRPDGGYTSLNTITAANGSYRVNGRFDYDAQWNIAAVHGVGLHDGIPVQIALLRQDGRVRIEVAGKGKPVRSVATCNPTCLIDMAPSATPMFTMTRHYDFATGGEQEFLWAGQDLVRPQALSDDRVRIVFKGEDVVQRGIGPALTLRHFAFLETIPQPGGSPYMLSFDIWTDMEHRPLAFRVRPPGSSAVGTVGLRKGFEDLRERLVGP
jgi:hypothetical protein